MAKTNKFAMVFIDEYSKELEQATKRNINRITTHQIAKKSHAKIVQILQNAKQLDNEYLEYTNFEALIQRLKAEQKSRFEKAQITKKTVE